MRNRLALLLLLLASATALADVPIKAERVEIGKGFVKIFGTSAPRARVSAFDGGSCEGDAVGTVRAGRGGGYTLELRTNGDPPYLVSLKAATRGDESACLGGTIEPPDDEQQAAAEPEEQEQEQQQEATDEVVEQPARPERPGAGMCMGIPTRCGLLPKGVCFMQAGCYNPYMGDRCGGTAKQCTAFYTKSACHMQQGCVWTK